MGLLNLRILLTYSEEQWTIQFERNLGQMFAGHVCIKQTASLAFPVNMFLDSVWCIYFVPTLRGGHVTAV